MVYDRGKSNFQTIKHESVLGPLLFLIYINDFLRSCNVFNFLMYVDDTTLYCKGSISLDNELDYIADWLACNKLSLNIIKPNLLLFIVSVKI